MRRNKKWEKFRSQERISYYKKLIDSLPHELNVVFVTKHINKF